jgi:hypothetical protein
MIECLGFKLVKKKIPNSYFCLLIFEKKIENDKNVNLNTKAENLNSIFVKKVKKTFP